MADHTIISLRVSTALKKRLQAAARRNGQSVSAFIKEQLETVVTESDNRHDPPTAEEWEVFNRFVGGGDLGGVPTPKEIDRIVYGKS